MADATMPVATTSRIIPLIMNEAPDLRAALLAHRRDADSMHELSKGGYCAADTAAEKERAHEAPL